MLDRLVIRNFKRFDEVEIELGHAVVLIGPNNSGKTSALQALALWELGVRRWSEKRGFKEVPAIRSGVPINRRDLVSVPVPDTNLLWRDLHVQKGMREDGKTKTQKISIEIEVHGVSEGASWSCGLEFYDPHAESLYCRPLGWARKGPQTGPGLPEAAARVRVAYLPPMSGLAANEARIDPGAVQVRLGEGRTAEVLRNLCFQLHPTEGPRPEWTELVSRIEALFGVTLAPPEYVPERGEITMKYLDRRIEFDLSAAGRGMQQTLLLLAYLYANPGAVLLLDEPDAHLEILRQEQIYDTLTEIARSRGSQVIAASHSEVLLNAAADRDVVVAFVGKPHRIDDRVSQVAKALKSIGFEHYFKAEQTGWVLYIEGATDLAILRAFAQRLGHSAASLLERPFFHCIGNQANKARDHFYGLQEAKRDLVGLILTDRLEREVQPTKDLEDAMWIRREIENYLCFPEVLDAYASELGRETGEFFASTFMEDMRSVYEGLIIPAALRDRGHTWWERIRASEDLLDPVFEAFFEKLGLPNLMRKTDYHRLARLLPSRLFDPEIVEKLDLIVATARRARPTVVEKAD